ncbi:MAG: hypothetical protein U0T77_10595 [Chitinophagales bacterium]
MSLNNQQSERAYTCDHCNQNPGPNPRNKALWYGFFDQDTKQYVCMGCKEMHYHVKAKTTPQGLYSELPVTMQLMYKN